MRKTTLLSIILVILVVGGVAAFFFYQSKIKNPTEQTPSAVNQQLPLSNNGTPPIATEKCVVSSCHYYGSNIPLECAPASAPLKLCTEEKRVGDECLYLAKCESVDGACRAIETPEFKECIKKAEKRGA